MKLQINSIKRYIDKHNTEQRVLNIEFFGPIDPKAPVFVVFVDKFKINLKYLLVSLTNLSGIEDALIIFSHAVYDENVNNLIRTIDFTRVLQIFYPYSTQLYPNAFPGYQEGDCPHNMDMDTARSINCTGADTPDIHGRYRDPQQAQMKHYWWWTMNKVFDNLSIIKDHKGIFTFLEDDVFLMEDFIYMNLKMKSIGALITKCEMSSLFSPMFEFSYFQNVSSYAVELTTWDPKHYPTVLSFDSSVWSSIAAHYYLFCYIDDYSWARSLYYLSLNRKDGGRFKVMSSTMPRAFKTSSSALYDHILDNEMIHTVCRILDMQERNKLNLYPPYLEVYLNIELDEDDFVIFDYVDNNGGWNDPRDKSMCSNITTNKIKKIIMDMAHEFHQYDLGHPN
ncbi:hypothetical protein B5X24_HaOG206149 [Helicoverpa armigera]|nr:hypothetical protein B5X24_HaOG206149 [Helicoverpa armigera]